MHCIMYDTFVEWSPSNNTFHSFDAWNEMCLLNASHKKKEVLKRGIVSIKKFSVHVDSMQNCSFFFCGATAQRGPGPPHSCGFYNTQ